MIKTYKVANLFRTKLAQYQIREYDMGNPKAPNLENMVKNIQTIIRGFNALSTRSADATQLDNILQQLNELGIQFNQ